MTILFPPRPAILLLGAATTLAQPPPPSVLAPEWTSSLPFVALFEGEVVQTSSSPGGVTEDRLDRAAVLGVASSSSDDGAGSAWHRISNDLSFDPEEQYGRAARNDYEVTHFDGLGGAVRMAAKQCPPPNANGEQKYDDPSKKFGPCQCSIDITSKPLRKCTLPTKFSCLPKWEKDCVPTEEDGCPLSEFVQRRWWGYAPPTCDVRPLDDADFALDVGPSDMPWDEDTEFAVCESRSAMSGQIEAIFFEDDGLPGVPSYDVEGYGTQSHQSSSKTSFYLVNMDTDSPLPSDYEFFLDDSDAFLDCLSEDAAREASETFCNGRGEWYASPGNEPFPFSCVCDDPKKWTGDRCDVAVDGDECPPCYPGTTGTCQHKGKGNNSCIEKNSDGTCPNGYSACPNDPGEGGPDPAQCEGCASPSSGVCKNPGNNVCYDLVWGSCPPGTQPC